MIFDRWRDSRNSLLADWACLQVGRGKWESTKHG